MLGVEPRDHVVAITLVAVLVAALGDRSWALHDLGLF